jgi:hypothetical protein
MKTYDNALFKREVQNIALQSCNSKIYGLAGPNADIYLEYLKKRGFSDITLFENNYNTFFEQKKKKLDCKLVYDDIRNYLSGNAFYDYDFCCNITTVEPWLPKMLLAPEYAMTFSIRGIGQEETLRVFRKYTSSHYIRYRDTSPMITFFKHSFIT